MIRPSRCNPGYWDAYDKGTGNFAGSLTNNRGRWKAVGDLLKNAGLIAFLFPTYYGTG